MQNIIHETATASFEVTLKLEHTLASWDTVPSSPYIRYACSSHGFRLQKAIMRF